MGKIAWIAYSLLTDKLKGKKEYNTRVRWKKG
jgi:hypothetical protein